MPKLSTPVQYESTLEGLNDLRPLQLAAKGKIVLSFPVLCKNPPSKRKPVIGKLARCTRWGALLTNRPKVFTAYEYIEPEFTQADPEKLIQFSQKVSFVQTQIVSAGTWISAYWTDPTYTAEIADIYNNNTNFLPFVGTDLYAKVTNAVPGFTTKLGFWGFY